MVTTCGFRRFALLVVVIFLSTFTIFVNSALGQTDDSGDVLDTFERTYAEIIAQVKKGKLSAEVGAEATELQISLKKYLIKSEAQLEILQLDVLDGSREKRQAALNKMVAISAERELIKIGYLQRLQAVKGSKGSKGGGVPLFPVEPEQSKATGEKSKASGEKAAQKKENSGWTTKFLNMEVEIAPEDITDGERP